MHESFDAVLKENNFDSNGFYGKIFEIARNKMPNFVVLDFYGKFPHESPYFHDPTHLDSFGAEMLSKDEKIQNICGKIH